MKPIPNSDRLHQARYASAYAVLTSATAESGNTKDIYRAENMFIELLNSAHIPFWMRVQCNAILANISDDALHAQHYLNDASHILDCFEQQQLIKHDLSSIDQYSEKSRVDDLRAELQSIQQRLNDQEMLLSQEADAALHPLAQKVADDKEMLLGPEENVQGMQQMGLDPTRGETTSPATSRVHDSLQSEYDAGTADTDMTSQTSDATVKAEDSDVSMD